MSLKEIINNIKYSIGLIYHIFKQLFKELRCKHEYEFGYNIYGDPIIFHYNFNRSAWFCKKCGKYQGRPYLVEEKMDDKRFLKESDNTGRFIVKSKITGKKYYVEVIGNVHAADWGNLDPATKKMTGNYGERYEGCVFEKESLITKENGFEKIEILDPGVSPLSEIDRRDREYQKQMGL